VEVVAGIRVWTVFYTVLSESLEQCF
jgi:hypothetical protein